MVLVNIEWC